MDVDGIEEYLPRFAVAVICSHLLLALFTPSEIGVTSPSLPPPSLFWLFVWFDGEKGAKPPKHSPFP
jgi:hypothetical protein